MKRDENATDQLVNTWVKNLLQNPNQLLALPLSNDFKSPWGVNIMSDFLSKEASVTISEAQRRKHLTLPLMEKMDEMQIVVKGASSRENLIRQRMLHWYNTLSFDDKKCLPRLRTSVNNICFRSIGAEQRSWASFGTQYEWIAKTIDEIHENLFKIGIIGEDFRTVTERKRPIKDVKSSVIEWVSKVVEDVDALWEIPISKANTPLGFNVAVGHIQSAIGIAESSAIKNREFAYPLIEKMIQKGILVIHDEPYEVAGIENRRQLLNWYRHLSEQEKHKLPIHGNQISLTRMSSEQRPIKRSCLKFSAVQNALNFIHQDLKELGLIDKNYKSVVERKSEKLVYQQEPNEYQKERFNRLATKKLNTTTDFLDPSNSEPFIQIEQLFASQSNTVPSESGKNNYILLPYLLRLAQVTGLNTDSLLSLDIDDYEPCHPATSRPCLRYWKERSDGHKEYHLDLFNAQLTWLTSTQAKSVKEIFQEVIQLTSSFRQHIEDDALENRLFIYQSNGTKKHGRASPLLGNEEKNTKSLGESIARFVKKYSLKNDKGEPLVLTISRFRPTFVSEMLDSGVSLREIQLMLGHSSIQTTIRYLDSLDFNSISREKLNNKLKGIHQSTLDRQTEESTQKLESKKNAELVVTFHTPLAECKNIFDPPAFVKKLSSYIPGTPCSQYNKCLGCDNVIITAKNLPEIFAMKRDYTLLTEHTRIMDTPYGHVILENLELIKGIIDPELSDFSIEELEDGRRLAEYIETTTLVDGAI